MVASSNNFPPLNLLDDQGELQGFGRELSDAVFRAMGVEVQRLHTGRWPEVLDWIASGRADLIHDTGYTPEREAYLDFTAPILTMDEVIFVRSEQIDIHDLKSLVGKRVACINQHITHLYLKQFDWIDCVLFATPVEGVQALLNGQVDAFIYPREIVLYHLQQRGGRDRIKTTGSALRTLSWSMAVKRGNRALVERLNRGIQEVQDSGAYQRIHDKWFGKPVLIGYSGREVWLMTLGAGATAAGLFLALGFALYSRVLSRANLKLQNTLEHLRDTKSALSSTENRFRFAMDAVHDGLWDWNLATQRVDFSPGWQGILGTVPQSARMSAWEAHIHPEDWHHFKISLQAHLAGETDSWSVEHRLRDVHGNWIWTLGRGRVVERDAAGHPLRMVGSLSDISHRRRSDDQLRHLAYYDQLTGLPNRTLLLNRLAETLDAARRSHRQGAVLYGDLDQFQQINDLHGHGAGDAVLLEVARRLSTTLRGSDTVARFGGDAFVVLLPDLDKGEDPVRDAALAVGRKLLHALDVPIDINGQPHHATVSFGITLFPKANETVDDLIREADIAMARAKQAGRNTAVFFEPAMESTLADRYALEHDLRHAVNLDQMELHVQSKFDPAGTLVGGEVLLRWRHPTRGLIPPARFIALAEECGVILSLGEWVLRRSCALSAQLASAGCRVTLSVNVSPRQFHQADFCQRCREILGETGADPTAIVFEITENLLIEESANLVPRMMELASLGIRFALDDFGTGYSSLAYLKRLPLHELKIDKSFVDELPEDTNDVAIVETIIAMAHHLGLVVVAEGVETTAQRDFLANRGCNHFQGYLFHRPEAAPAWLAQQQAASALRAASSTVVAPDRS